MANTVQEAMLKAIWNAKKDSDTRQMFIAALSIPKVGKIISRKDS